MQSFDKRFTILFNGEIYNFKEIKKKLIENNSNENKINFKGTSDTEVLINCISFFGIDKTLSLIEGQYAIALWDDFKKIFILLEIDLVKNHFIMELLIIPLSFLLN